MRHANNELLTSAEVANRYGWHRGTLANWRCKGVGPPYVRFGGRVYYRTSAIDEFLAQCTVVPRPQSA